MKQTFLLALIPFLSLAARCQDTTWSDGVKETTRDKAIYYRIKARPVSGTGWQVTDYFLSGKLQMTGVFTDDSCKVPQGEFVYYNDKGHMMRRANYTAGKEEGQSIYYYENGHVQAEGPVRDNAIDGEWKSYFKTGKPAGKAVFSNGRQLSAKFFNEDGSPNKAIDSFFKESRFPKGDAALGRFLTKNLQFPDQGIKDKKGGRVIVEFIVSKEGMIRNARVIQSAGRAFDAEALRVIRSMPEWEPALLGGIPTDTYKRQPFEFQP